MEEWVSLYMKKWRRDGGSFERIQILERSGSDTAAVEFASNLVFKVVGFILFYFNYFARNVCLFFIFPLHYKYQL